MTLPTTRDPSRRPDSRPLPCEPMTYQQFLDWADDERHAEWVAGKVEFTSPRNLLEDRLIDFLRWLFRSFLLNHPLGEYYGDPVQMKTSPDLPGRAPDLFFVTNEHLERLQRSHLEGPADLAIEVVAPDSRQRDGETKFGEYEQGGVREYWLLEPDRQQADFYELDADGRFQPIPLEEGGIFRSRVLPGFWLKVEWLWQSPLPYQEAIRAWASSDGGER
jgi:Uma2 family endonuclease